MENCIFCDLVKENDPIKVPEQGKDYSIIEGTFLSNDSRFEGQRGLPVQSCEITIPVVA